METYIIVKIEPREAGDLTDRQLRARMGRVRKAIHSVYDEMPEIHGSDIVTDTYYVTKEDSKTVRDIFERSMRKAKEIFEWQKALEEVPPTDM